MSDFQKNFLIENRISPTRLLQKAINEAIENQKMFRAENISEKIASWRKVTYQYRDFLEKKGLLDEFLGETETKQ